MLRGCTYDEICKNFAWEIPEYFNVGANNFSITLYNNNLIEITYGDISAKDGIVGITQGGGAADPGETDLSQAKNLSFTGGTVYEQFIGGSDSFDLQDMTLKFRQLSL